MSRDIPMASHLLASKMFGVSVRKLAESVGPPLIVPIVLYAIGFPLLVTAPFVLLGGIVGYGIYVRTPQGQRPLRYAGALARHVRGRTDYVWKPTAAGEHEIAHREPFEEWITGRLTSDTAAVGDGEESDGLVVDVDTGSGTETESTAGTGLNADWPVATTMTTRDRYD
ncbi:hypothetical protein EFA46_015470 (plasmid) [Halarchaeum sp. CBA1220]|uniref:hypothetical protein n=1 Tax=Halarchaeum sp. CBA1220 TaxID=1853682 RepID=UPI0011CE6317|nr:hypothetical protein [Halarchaeum sp. CBA1220]QLC35658.1 hypothetical protein EFA46_015470 [Halarchaeum sp. CBA1220]